MKFTWIAAEKAFGEFMVSELCRALRVSPSGYYASLKREPSARAKKDVALRVRIRASFEGSRKTYGSPRVLEDLRDDGETVGRNRVIRLMQQEGLRARPRKRFKNTTNSNHDQPVAANVLARKFDAAASNQRLVSDTTELLTTSGGKFFPAAIVDLYSRRPEAGIEVEQRCAADRQHQGRRRAAPRIPDTTKAGSHHGIWASRLRTREPCAYELAWDR